MKKHIFCVMLAIVSMLCFACGGQDGSAGSDPSGRTHGVMFGYKLEVLDESGNNVLKYTTMYAVLISNEMKPQKEYSVFVGSFVGLAEKVYNGGEIEFEPYKNLRFEYDDKYMAIKPDEIKGDGYYVLTTTDKIGKTLLCIYTGDDYCKELDCIMRIVPGEEE